MRTVTIAAILAISVGSLAAAGCKNPATGKDKAEVGEAKEVKEGPLAGSTEKAVLTPKNTKIQWKGSKVTGSHMGNFAKFTGSIESSGTDPTKARIILDIDMTSVTSDNPKLTGHLKSAGFFDVKNHPKARFISTSITAGGKKGASHTITGNLTMRGVTKSVAFPAKIKITDSEVHATAEFWIDRNLWGIAFKGMKNDLIRKEVVLKLDVKVRRQKK